MLPFGPGGRLGTVRTVPLTGDLVYAAGVNANGIVAGPDGKTLLIGDGLLRRGNTLFVMRNQNNQIVRIALGRNYASGRVTGTITDPNFYTPTTTTTYTVVRVP